MVTLKSEAVATPPPEVEEEKILGANGGSASGFPFKSEAARPGPVKTETVREENRRPTAERFDTAQEVI